MKTIAINEPVWIKMKEIVDNALAREFNYNVHPSKAALVFADELKNVNGALKGVQIIMDSAEGKISDFPEIVEAGYEEFNMEITPK